MVAVPAKTPVTAPVVLTVAVELLLLLHVPPAGDELRVMLAPSHTEEAPVIAAGCG